MNRTKDYLNHEAGYQQQAAFVSSNKSRGRRGSNLAGRPASTGRAEPELSVLLRQLALRLRRTWISAWHRFNASTYGVFQNRTTLKIGALTLAGYVMLSTDRDPSLLFSNPIAYFVGEDDERQARTQGSVTASELHFEVGGGSGGGTGDGHSKPVSWKSNDAAPVAASDLAEEQAREYIGRFGKIAQAEMDKFGIPASISLAQGLVESRAGTSTLARRNNNHFGMKCFSKKCRKGHCSNFTDDHHKDFFRIYKNAWESWRAHSEMLASGRYASLKKYGDDYKKWAYGLKSIGYATDRNYAEKLIGMIERYELYRYDN